MFSPSADAHSVSQSRTIFRKLSHRARIFEAEAGVTVAPASRYGMLEASTTYQIYRQAFEDSITQNLSVVGQNPRHNLKNITQDCEYTNADTKGLPPRRR